MDIVLRAPSPLPWDEGENIPWDDPDFGERMLREHLSQEHDAASRRSLKIDEQISWIHERVLSGQPARVLDLACGPGLYVTRLARLGHACTGIDYSPVSIAYAASVAEEEGLPCELRLGDVRTTEFGGPFGLVMMIFGQFNVFRREEASDLLARAFAATEPAGSLLLEVQTWATVESGGVAPASWYSAESGLFSDSPHICLTDSSWDAGRRTSTIRFFVIDVASGDVSRHALSNEAYDEAELVALIEAAGFTRVEVFPSLIGAEDESQSANVVFLGTRPS